MKTDTSPTGVDLDGQADLIMGAGPRVSIDKSSNSSQIIGNFFSNELSFTGRIYAKSSTDWQAEDRWGFWRLEPPRY